MGGQEPQSCLLRPARPPTPPGPGDNPSRSQGGAGSDPGCHHGLLKTPPRRSASYLLICLHAQGRREASFQAAQTSQFSISGQRDGSLFFRSIPSGSANRRRSIESNLGKSAGQIFSPDGIRARSKARSLPGGQTQSRESVEAWSMRAISGIVQAAECRSQLPTGSCPPDNCAQGHAPWQGGTEMCTCDWESSRSCRSAALQKKSLSRKVL
jgi:hypothetical protein